MNLNDIIQAAQGGQGVANLGGQFGLTPEQTQAAVQALMPAFSSALQRMTSDPSSLGGIVSHLASGVHQGSFTGSDPAAAGANGSGALGQIFGSSQVASQIAARASSASGVDAQTIQQMMPALASMLLGGLAHSLTAQGFGGVLGQLASAVETPASPGATAQGGGLGGLVSSLVGNLFGGGQSGQAASGLAQAGLTALTGMLESGVPSASKRASIGKRRRRRQTDDQARQRRYLAAGAPFIELPARGPYLRVLRWPFGHSISGILHGPRRRRR